jgi:hypothetical protein
MANKRWGSPRQGQAMCHPVANRIEPHGKYKGCGAEKCNSGSNKCAVLRNGCGTIVTDARLIWSSSNSAKTERRGVKLDAGRRWRPQQTVNLWPKRRRGSSPWASTKIVRAVLGTGRSHKPYRAPFDSVARYHHACGLIGRPPSGAVSTEPATAATRSGRS